jgi:hypothetical protein
MNKNELGEACGTYDKEKCIPVLVWKPKEKNPPARRKHKLNELNVNTQLQETGFEGVGLNDVQDRHKRLALVCTVMNLWVLP